MAMRTADDPPGGKHRRSDAGPEGKHHGVVDAARAAEHGFRQQRELCVVSDNHRSPCLGEQFG
jgi:hypothetical protein